MIFVVDRRDDMKVFITGDEKRFELADGVVVSGVFVPLVGKRVLSSRVGLAPADADGDVIIVVVLLVVSYS